MWASHGEEKRLETNDTKWEKSTEKISAHSLLVFGDDFYCKTRNVCSV